MHLSFPHTSIARTLWKKTKKISPVDCTMSSFWFIFFRLQFWNVSDTIADCLYCQLVARCGHSRRRTTNTSLRVTNFRRDKTTISIDMLRFRHANNEHIQISRTQENCSRVKRKKAETKSTNERNECTWMSVSGWREVWKRRKKK